MRKTILAIFALVFVMIFSSHTALCGTVSGSSAVNTYGMNVVPLHLNTQTNLSKAVYGFYPWWLGSDAYLNFDFSVLTTIAWFSVGVNTDGSLNTAHPPPWDFINKSHSERVPVALTATCFDADAIDSVLAYFNQTVATNLLYEVQKYNLDGICIDFEGIRTMNSINSLPNKGLFAEFIRIVNTTFKSINISYSVTVCTPAVDWRDAFDYYALANYTDGLIIMAYDYHWKGSSYAGPVAPLTGGTYNIMRTVEDYIVKTNNQTSKLILGVPYYGYDWPTVSDSPGAATLGTGTAVTYRNAYSDANNYGTRWDNASQTPYYIYQSGGVWHQVWFDNVVSLRLKYRYVCSKNLAGIAIWALGYDGNRTDLWQVLASEFTQSYPKYNRTAAAQYADLYWQNYNTEDYADYSGVGGDCANFVSQALIAGGLSLWQGDDGAGHGVDIYGAMPFCDYLAGNLKNYQTCVYSYIENTGTPPPYLTVGDVIMYGDSADYYRHAVIVVGGSGNNVIIDSHTTDRHHEPWDYAFPSPFPIANFFHLDVGAVTYTQFEVTATALNVRTGPSTAYDIIGQINAGEQYLAYGGVQGTSHYWYQFWFDDRNAFCAKTFTQPVSGNTAFRVDVTPYLNVRVAPSTTATIDDSIFMGQAFVAFDSTYADNFNWWNFWFGSETRWCAADYTNVIIELNTFMIMPAAITVLCVIRKTFIKKLINQKRR
jgi:hypothetical protein